MAKEEKSYAIRTEIIKDATEEDYRQLEAGTYQTVTSDTITTLEITYPDDIVVINPRIESPTYEVLKGGTIVIVEVTEFIINTEPADAEGIIKTIGSDYVVRLMHGDTGARPSYRILDEDVNTVFEDLKQEYNSNVCPICYSKLDPQTWEDDPTKTKNGIAGRQYIGTQNIKTNHLKDIQDIRKEQEQDTLPIESLTVFSPINDTGKFNILKSHITELRESTEKILAVEGLTKEEYFNFDEDGLNRGTNQIDWHDPNLGDSKGYIKAIHIEDLRHHIDFSQLYSTSLDTIYKWKKDNVGLYEVSKSYLEEQIIGINGFSVAVSNKYIFVYEGSSNASIGKYDKNHTLLKSVELPVGANIGEINDYAESLKIVGDYLYILADKVTQTEPYMGWISVIIKLDFDLNILSTQELSQDYGTGRPWTIDDNYIYMSDSIKIEDGYYRTLYAYILDNMPISELKPGTEPNGLYYDILEYTSSQSIYYSPISGLPSFREYFYEGSPWTGEGAFDHIQQFGALPSHNRDVTLPIYEHCVDKYELSTFTLISHTIICTDREDFYSTRIDSINVDDDNLYIALEENDYSEVPKIGLVNEVYTDRDDYGKSIKLMIYNKSSMERTHLLTPVIFTPADDLVTVFSIGLYRSDILISYITREGNNKVFYSLKTKNIDGSFSFGVPVDFSDNLPIYNRYWGDSTSRIST